MAPQFSAKELIETTRAKFGEFDRNAPFYSARTYDQTLPYELGRTVTLVDYTDEIALGLRMEPQKGIPSIIGGRPTASSSEVVLHWIALALLGVTLSIDATGEPMPSIG
jgi:hypothetical protein